MNWTTSFFVFISNKYIVTLLAFVVFMLFIDHNDLFLQYERKQELTELKKSKAYYEDLISKTQMELNALQNNADAIEKYAREKFYMKRENEDVYTVIIER